jgi:4-oxalocrotonate tautomerase
MAERRSILGRIHGGTMPFVTIRFIEGRSQQQKDEIAKRVNDALSEVLELPKNDIWIVFEDSTAKDWYVGGSTAAELREKGLIAIGKR